MKIYENNEGFIFQEYEDGNGILLEVESGTVYLLNTTALLLYKLCDGSRGEDELFEAFMECIDISDEDINEVGVKADFYCILKEFDENEIPFRVVSDEEDEIDDAEKIQYVKPEIDIFQLEDLLGEIEGRKTTSAHCSHCYRTFA